MTTGPCITLFTDYGVGNEFVGSLHAVIARILPSALVIDLDHTVPPYRVRVGALRLERLVGYLPEGVHVCVVDPGVGTPRRPVAIEAGTHVFIGPDNGLLPWPAERCSADHRAIVLDRPEWWLPTQTRTFDGRDIFAPCAAQLLAGHSLDELGSLIDWRELKVLERPTHIVVNDRERIVEVIDVDRFGNVILPIRSDDPEGLDLRLGQRVQFLRGDVSLVEAPFSTSFADVRQGTAALYFDSSGSLSLAINRGDAADTWNLHVGEQVTIRHG